MSSFKVSVEKIAKIIPIPGADSIEIAVLDGMNFQFVVGKGQFKEGEAGVYFPLDSVLPEDVLKAIGLFGKLSSKKRNRVKTKKFLGQISQGVMGTLTDLWPWVAEQIKSSTDYASLDLTTALDVFKYEPAVYGAKFPGRSMPVEVTIYDIEGAQKHKRVVEELMDVDVVITEKLEGANYAAILYKDGTFKVCSHRRQLERQEDYTDHDWFKIADKIGLQDKMQAIFDRLVLADDYIAKHQPAAMYKPEYITIRGEGLGPKWQKNIYKLPELDIRFFELEVNGKPLSPFLAKYHTTKVGLEFVPVLYEGKLRGFLKGRTLIEASHGKSVLNDDTLREGVVIRPANDITITHFGRVILKQRDPIYLSKQK